MKHRKKVFIIVILLLAIGFAAVSTSLIINGNISFNTNVDDFNVYFSKGIVDGVDLSSEIIDDTKKVINFSSNNLKFKAEESILEYVVTNESKQYDASVSINCVPSENEYVKVTNTLSNELIKAQSKEKGILKIKLKNTVLDEVEIKFTCTLEVLAVERIEEGIESCNTENQSAPIITGGVETWESEDVVISVESAGSAISGVKEYEYLITASEEAEEGETGTTENELVISKNGTYYVRYRTIANSGCISDWSNVEKVMVDKTEPIITLNTALPSSVTRGDSYQIVKTYTTSELSGGTLKCESNLDGEVTNTSTLKTLGEHTISCTAKTGANVTTSKSVKVLITYAPYSATNLLTDGSFENGTYTWYNGVVTTSTAYAKYGSKSLYLSADNDQVWGRTNLTGISGLKNHVLYGTVSYFETVPELHPYLYLIFSDETVYWPSEYNDIHKNHLDTTIYKWQEFSVYGTSKYNYLSNMMLAQGSTTGTGLVYFDGLIIVDLTAVFGAGNEPSKEWCDNHISYFNGSKTIYK